MNYKIISSGSQGNAVLVENILIDCGVPYKALCDLKFNLVLLTHCHSDHFNKSTIKKIAFEKPTCKFVCGKWLVNDLLECGVKNSNIYIDSASFRGLMVSNEPLIHDVSNCGWKIFFEDANKRVFYATDTKTLDHIKATNYDLYLVEGNYCEEDIKKRIAEKQEKNEFCYEFRVLETHLSIENALNWLEENMGVKSKFELIHQHKERK